jgi:hypothetical protein
MANILIFRGKKRVASALTALFSHYFIGHWRASANVGRGLLCCSRRRVPIGDNDVRGEAHQFGRIGAHCVDMPSAETKLDPQVATFDPAGGLISYGPDYMDQYRRAAGYVDRILRGEQPADLPVQAPVKYATVLNMQTAKTLGLTIPETLLATADEVIQ